MEHTSPHSWVQCGVTTTPSPAHASALTHHWDHKSSPGVGAGRRQGQAGAHNALCCLPAFHRCSTPEGSFLSPIKHTLYLWDWLPSLGPLGIRGVFLMQSVSLLFAFPHMHSLFFVSSLTIHPPSCSISAHYRLLGPLGFPFCPFTSTVTPLLCTHLAFTAFWTPLSIISLITDMSSWSWLLTAIETYLITVNSWYSFSTTFLIEAHCCSPCPSPVFCLCRKVKGDINVCVLFRLEHFKFWFTVLFASSTEDKNLLSVWMAFILSHTHKKRFFLFLKK